MVQAAGKSSLLGAELLINTVQELSLAHDMEAVMRIVRTVARDLTGADGATFVLREGDSCYYADENAISPLWKGSRFPLKSCISGWAMQNRKSAVIPDIYVDERIPLDAYRPTFVKSLAMVPIRTLDPIGAIGNYWASYHVPSEEEVSLLQALADITAVSIENIFVRNLLEEKVVERTRELAASLERERELNLMKSAFVSMASHEFRTPLSAILSSAALAEKYTETGQQTKSEKHFSRIKSSVQNMMDILNDLLSIDKLEQGKVECDYEVFDIDVCFQDIIEQLDGMRKGQQVIHYSCMGNKNVWLDPKIFRHIFVNLLTNAIKYSTKDIELKADVTPDEIKVSVIDSGIGIPEAQQINMFSKFFRASNARTIQGTGLGLNIVKSYVMLLDGTIDFVSKEGQGTTFTVRLPNTFEKEHVPIV